MLRSRPWDPWRFRNLSALVVSVFALAGSSAAQTSLLVNGGFEEGPPVGSFVNVRGGATSIKGWVVTGEGVDYVASLWHASDGRHSIDLDGSARSTKTPPYSQGGIAQTFGTTPGKSYKVTFDLAGNVYGPPRLKPMRVSAAGQQMNFTFDITGKNPRNMGWVSESWVFNAEKDSTTVEFRSLTTSPGTGWGAVIDHVSVSEIDKSQP